ncbi:MAG: NADH-quinone oxidoreductase subunit NuoH [Planctomycetota bacterium]|nr:NADH-quinone oxidoreductase subunit NuoH [Planctomycetota bacterium]
MIPLVDLAVIAAPVLGLLADVWEFFSRGPDGAVTFGWVLGRIIVVLIIVHVLLILSALMVWAERRVSAWMQDRLGPNRVGPEGLLQPLADLGKFMFKEDVIPGHTNKLMYTIAPLITVVPAMITFAVIPFTGTFEMNTAGEEAAVSWQAADLNIGVLYILAITGLGVYGITLGGWAGNSKYSLLGGVRASAQMISYELSLGLAVVPVVLICGSLNLGEIVAHQADSTWLVFSQPLAAFIFLVAIYAETNRLPFDMPEAETELVAGYHTEYSSMKFALFFMGEYVAMVTGSALLVTLFLGGWTFFGLEQLGWWMGLLIFSAKVLFFLFAFIWVRWTIPRFRYDQLMKLGWVVFLPLTLVNVVLTAGAIALDANWIYWVLPLLVIGSALGAAYIGWKQDEHKIKPLPDAPGVAGGGEEA